MCNNFNSEADRCLSLYICPYKSEVLVDIWWTLMNKFETSDLDYDPIVIYQVKSDNRFLEAYKAKFGVDYED
jgi:hypothetical protein